ncbi:MAG: 3-deoxy-D-manno-octulosonate 8-phosphate phosphatase [Flavobacteriales bacterium]|nr:3-deoxy-D-manno-octulosonate 8-phosphate phosphatase [Flavobacteriales bacterium]|tara:strand:- start:974 stop:1483 length:510 start_codon:yes stop_codon:yes gene_type:complete
MIKDNYKKILKNINTLIFDVDGVLTNGDVLVTTNGEILRNMNTKDGFALKTAINSGLNVCIISGGNNLGVKKRLKDLGIENIILGTLDKLKDLNKLITKLKIKKENVMYMGDDIPDLNAMMSVGLACCPNDAVNEVRKIADYVSHLKGGDGAVRDIIEQILKIQGHWEF